MLYDITTGVPYVPQTAVCSVCGVDRPVAGRKYKEKPAGVDPNTPLQFDAFCTDCMPDLKQPAKPAEQE